MSFGEAWRLTGLLAVDPSSQVAAAVSGWEHPASREALVLMDLLDVQAKSKFKNPKPYPRPYKDKATFGKSAFDQEETRAILAARSRGTT